MTRPIDADALLEKLNDINVTLVGALIEEQRTVAFYVYCKVVEALEKMPTIDAVPVVRCKDCKYWNKLTQYSLDAKPIGRCAITSTLKSGDGYCEKAAKMDEMTP